ncbi:hypothetical protein LARV_01564 [Longilinea arvoryzae]|uniref:Uncharacterized protein n=1 Tax=Longilinea arvoryzae TaxID=360412 RepID=A0A0S7BIX1_9CHLR|nr:hypothetical protein [Longilinea arvoryzae]GAP13809.1 hypothetical protein LARV_01564 [Longilinea arvoryzae]
MTNLSCSIAFSRVISEAAVDVLGEADAANLPVSPRNGVDIEKWIDALQKNYGPNGSKGIAQRMGQAAFKYFLNSYGRDLNLTGLDFHLLPSAKRLRTGLKTVSQKLGQECGADIQLDADNNAYYWRISLGSTAEVYWIQNGFAYFLAGMAQELMSWSGGGKVYNVREVMDKTVCVLKMDQRPLD